MKAILLMLSCLFAVTVGSAKKREKTNLDKEERQKNTYAFRKYSFVIADGPYFNIKQGAGFQTAFGAFEMMFADKIKPLDFGGNGKFETMWGMGFEPYQGTLINIGVNYELLGKQNKINLDIGVKYTLGLAQSSSLKDDSVVNVGFHNYVTPFVNINWHPWKKDVVNGDTLLYQHPGFKQLLFFRLQIGYSNLIGNPKIDVPGPFDPQKLKIISDNTSNTLNIRLCIGLNIPTAAKHQSVHGKYINRREQYYEFLKSNDMYKK